MIEAEQHENTEIVGVGVNINNSHDEEGANKDDVSKSDDDDVVDKDDNKVVATSDSAAVSTATIAIGTKVAQKKREKAKQLLT